MTARIPCWASLAGSSFVVLLLVSGCDSSKSGPPIPIGHVAPLSGPQRESGLHAEDAIRLAVEEVKAGESLLANRNVEVRHADSEGSAETAQNVAVRLLSVNHSVALIGSPDPVAAERLCRIAQQYKVPVLLPVWLPAASLGSYAFSVAPSPVEQGIALAQFATEGLKPNRVVVLVDSRSPASIARAAAFVDSVGKSASIRRHEFASDQELRELSRSTLTGDPQAIFFAGNAADLETLATELRQGGPPARIPILFAGDEDPRLALLADRWAGIVELYWTTAFLAENAPAEAQDFIRKYQDKYKRTPGADAALAYDAARLLFEAIRQAKTARPDRIREELTKLKEVPGLTGPVSFEKNQITPRPVVVVYRQNKQWKWFFKAEKPPAGP